jgi:hypothetical protein
MCSCAVIFESRLYLGSVESSVGVLRSKAGNTRRVRMDSCVLCGFPRTLNLAEGRSNPVASQDECFLEIDNGVWLLTSDNCGAVRSSRFYRA